MDDVVSYKVKGYKSNIYKSELKQYKKNTKINEK